MQSLNTIREKIEEVFFKCWKWKQMPEGRKKEVKYKCSENKNTDFFRI